jgi:hypothetical protein
MLDLEFFSSNFINAKSSAQLTENQRFIKIKFRKKFHEQKTIFAKLSYFWVKYNKSLGNFLKRQPHLTKYLRNFN